MYFEVYLDSLFWLNLVMNFYILCITSRLKGKTATTMQIITGSFIGALVSCLVCMFSFLGFEARLSIGGMLSGIVMVKIVFKVKTIKAMLWKLGNMAVVAFFLGGTFLFLMNRIDFIQKYQNQTLIILLMGGVICIGAGYCLEKWKRRRGDMCYVTLENYEIKKRVEALIDTGNSLIEPISGKPVSILKKELIEELFNHEIPEIYRVVPFSCIGIEKGLLKCFELPRVNVEYEESIHTYEHVYVAYSDEYASQGGYQMILNPCLLR